jgi:hypothetical protein
MGQEATREAVVLRLCNDKKTLKNFPSTFLSREERPHLRSRLAR